jgi:hypothetical protein
MMHAVFDINIPNCASVLPFQQSRAFIALRSSRLDAEF